MVSACLIGENTKYDAGNNLSQSVVDLSNKFTLIPFCPEQLGGLPTPRPPSEIKNSNGFGVIEMKTVVLNNMGEDVTENFIKGAQESLKIAVEHEPEFIILKENSPSCGVHKIYDGSFCNKIIDGCGITTAFLIMNGYEVLSEDEIDKLH